VAVSRRDTLGKFGEGATPRATFTICSCVEVGGWRLVSDEIIRKIEEPVQARHESIGLAA
jgi:hypothetical protein